MSDAGTPPHLRHATSSTFVPGRSPSPRQSPPLSRSSTYTARTIRLPEKTVHVVRNPTEAFTLKDVEWVIEGYEQHVSSSIAKGITIVGIFETVCDCVGFEKV